MPYASTLDGSPAIWRLQNNTYEPTIVPQISRVSDCTIAFKDSKIDIVKLLHGIIT